MKNMKLRELINRLESISHNGINDNMDVSVIAIDEYGQDTYEYKINDARIHHFETSNDEYNFVGVEINE